MLFDRDSVEIVSINDDWWSPGDLEPLRTVLDVSKREVEESEENRSFRGAASPLLAHWLAATHMLVMVLPILVGKILSAVGPKAH